MLSSCIGFGLSRSSRRCWFVWWRQGRSLLATVWLMPFSGCNFLIRQQRLVSLVYLNFWPQKGAATPGATLDSSAHPSFRLGAIGAYLKRRMVCGSEIVPLRNPPSKLVPMRLGLRESCNYSTTILCISRKARGATLGVTPRQTPWCYYFLLFLRRYDCK